MAERERVEPVQQKARGCGNQTPAAAGSWPGLRVESVAQQLGAVALEREPEVAAGNRPARDRG